LVTLSLAASMELFTQFPGGGKGTQNRRDELFKRLPDEFETKGAIDTLASGENPLGRRTIERLLKEWVESGLLEKIEKGKYKKSADGGMS